MVSHLNTPIITPHISELIANLDELKEAIGRRPKATDDLVIDTTRFAIDMISSEAAGDTKYEDTLIKELEELCTSNLLSIKTLREKTNNIPQSTVDAIANSDYLLHAICKNDNISKSIVEHMLRLCPTGVNKPIRDGEMYPLHLAAANPHCPGSVIKLLVKKDASILEKRVIDDASAQVFDSNKFPLHYYILRGSNYDYGIMEYLVKSYPDALTYMPRNREDYNTPFKLLCGAYHGELSLDLIKLLAGTNNECLELVPNRLYRQPFLELLENSNIKPFPIDAVRYFIKHCAVESLSESHLYNGNFLHAACSNKNVTLEAMQLLLGIGSSDLLVRTARGQIDRNLPIHILCKNKGLGEDTSLAILKLLVDTYPVSVGRPDDNGFLPIHHACVNNLYKCCKYLIEKYPEGVVTKTSGSEETPFHLACANGSLQLVNLLYDVNPTSITEQTRDREHEYDDDGEYLDWTEYSNLQRGYYALHLAVSNQHPDRKDIVRFILEKDSRAASRVGTWGRLPLHQACASNMNLDIVKDIFKANPSAIHAKDMFGRFPIHYACGCAELRRNTFGGSHEILPSSKRQTSLVIEFLIEQLPYSLGAQDLQGRNCAHYASASSLAMKKISLIEKKCPESFKVYSDDHGFPIHYACTHGADVEVVGHLVLMLPGSIQMEHPLLGGPIACARDLGSFVLLLRLYRKCFSKSARGTPAFHAILQDDTIEVKYQIITRFIEFSQESKTEDFQDDVRTKDKKTGTLPLHLIFGGRNFRTLDSDDPEIQSFLLETNVQLLKDLIDCYPRALEEVDNQGWLPLHHAVRHNAPLEMIQLLIDRYPEGIQVADKQGSTVLHIACRHGSDGKVVNYLRNEMGEEGALVADNNGFTPLHIACKHSVPLDIFNYLVDIDNQLLSMQDNRGELPLHKACRGGHLHLIKEIIDLHPPSVSVRNHRNELPIFILCKRSGKDKEVRESVEYTETIWKLLLAHPETVSV